MRQATFELDPCHTLVIGGNDLPQVAGGRKTVDIAIRYKPLHPGPVFACSSGDDPYERMPKAPPMSADAARDPGITFYGPYPCEHCGRFIVKASREHGGAEFDSPDGPVYPNTKWVPHLHREPDLREQQKLGYSLQPSEARAIASMILSAATEARG